MTKINKIIEYGYNEEVDTLLDQGFSRKEIAQTINLNHDNKISHMSVQRYTEYREKEKINDMIDEGNDPGDIIIGDFRTGIRKNIKIADKVLNKSLDILKKVENSEDPLIQLRTVETVLKAVEQQKKGWTSLVQNGVRQMKFYGDVNIKKEQNIRILLLSWSREILKGLCPKCKSKSKEKIFEIIEKEEKENA